MGRPRYPRSNEPLPPPLPPETRTVGQLVAEAVHLYRRRFWGSLALGLGPAAAGVGLTFIRGWWGLGFVLTAGALLMTASYVGAIAIATETRPTRHSLVVAVGVGYLIFLPAPFLYSLLLLPVVAWLGLVGLAVPVAVVERRGLRDSFRRGLELGRADYLHAVGSLATLIIVAFLTSTVLFFLLRSGSKAALSAAAFMSLLVISPLLFLGSALLYYDQAARVVSSRSRPRRRSDADLRDALEPDSAGRADAEVEPRPSARG